jgi:hypothetical protein
MFDRKKGRFLPLFCARTAVRADKNDTCFRVFTVFWDLVLCNPLIISRRRRPAPFPKKSCSKTYRRFSASVRLCHNGSMNDENTIMVNPQVVPPDDATQTSGAAFPAGRTRNGKIARLPLAVRRQLNQRLQDGQPGQQLVQWPNFE